MNLKKTTTSTNNKNTANNPNNNNNPSNQPRRSVRQQEARARLLAAEKNNNNNNNSSSPIQKRQVRPAPTQAPAPTKKSKNYTLPSPLQKNHTTSSIEQLPGFTPHFISLLGKQRFAEINQNSKFLAYIVQNYKDLIAAPRDDKGLPTDHAAIVRLCNSNFTLLNLNITLLLMVSTLPQNCPAESTFNMVEKLVNLLTPKIDSPKTSEQRIIQNVLSAVASKELGKIHAFFTNKDPEFLKFLPSIHPFFINALMHHHLELGAQYNRSNACATELQEFLLKLTSVKYGCPLILKDELLFTLPQDIVKYDQLYNELVRYTNNTALRQQYEILKKHCSNNINISFLRTIAQLSDPHFDDNSKGTILQEMILNGYPKPYNENEKFILFDTLINLFSSPTSTVRCNSRAAVHYMFESRMMPQSLTTDKELQTQALIKAMANGDTLYGNALDNTTLILDAFTQQSLLPTSPEFISILADFINTRLIPFVVQEEDKYITASINQIIHVLTHQNNNSLSITTAFFTRVIDMLESKNIRDQHNATVCILHFLLLSALDDSITQDQKLIKMLFKKLKIVYEKPTTSNIKFVAAYNMTALLKENFSPKDLCPHKENLLNNIFNECYEKITNVHTTNIAHVVSTITNIAIIDNLPILSSTQLISLIRTIVSIAKKNHDYKATCMECITALLENNQVKTLLKQNSANASEIIDALVSFYILCRNKIKDHKLVAEIASTINNLYNEEPKFMNQLVDALKLSPNPEKPYVYATLIGDLLAHKKLPDSFYSNEKLLAAIFSELVKLPNSSDELSFKLLAVIALKNFAEIESLPQLSETPTEIAKLIYTLKNIINTKDISSRNSYYAYQCIETLLQKKDILKKLTENENSRKAITHITYRIQELLNDDNEYYQGYGAGLGAILAKSYWIENDFETILNKNMILKVIKLLTNTTNPYTAKRASHFISSLCSAQVFFKIAELNEKEIIKMIHDLSNMANSKNPGLHYPAVSCLADMIMNEKIETILHSKQQLANDLKQRVELLEQSNIEDLKAVAKVFLRLFNSHK